MKKLLATAAAALLLTGCIALPTLDAKYDTLAKDLSTYTCMAQKAGLIKEGQELTPEQLDSIIKQFQGQGGADAPQLNAEQIDQQMNELGQDPVQMALFFQALVGYMSGCATNSNA